MRGVALALAALLVAWVGWSSPWSTFAGDEASRVESDFQILRAAGCGLVEGRDIHDPFVLDDVGRRTGRSHTPFCAANPLVVRTYGMQAGSPFDQAYTAALVVNACLAILAVWLLASCLRAASSAAARTAWTTAFAIGLVALGAGEGLWMSLAMNSTNLLALVAVLAALRSALAGHPLAEGAFLALAAVAKTSPALLLLVVLFAGRRLAFAAGCAVSAGLAALSVWWSGWEIHASWLTRVLPVLGYAPDLEAGRFNNSLHAWNLSPNGVLSRTLLEADGPRMFALLGAWIVALLVLGQLVVSVRSRGRGGDRRTIFRVYALGLTATLLVSSVSWPHHLVFLCLPAAALLDDLRRGVDPPGLAGLACVALLALPLGMIDSDPMLTLGIPLRSLAVVLLFFVLAARLSGEDTDRGSQGGSAGDPDVQGAA